MRENVRDNKIAKKKCLLMNQNSVAIELKLNSVEFVK